MSNTLWKPLPEPCKLSVRTDIELRTAPEVFWSGAAVIAGVVIFFLIFW